jgi:MFS family permease
VTPSAPPPLFSRAWLVVGLLWMVGCLNYLDRLMIITMRGSIKEAIPMTDAQFGLLTTVFLFGYALLSPVGGYLADRFSRSRIIVLSLFLWSAATWMTAHATSLGELLATRVLMGLTEACYFPAAGALIADYHRNTTRSLANGIHLSGVMVGSGLGGLGGLLAERHDWTYAFGLFGVGGIAFALLLAVLLRDPPPAPAADDEPAAALPKSGVGETLRGLFGRADFVLAMVFWGLLGLASWSIIGWMPTFLTEHFHLSQGEAGLTTTGYVYAGSLVGMVASGAWADRWSRTHPSGRVFVGIIGLAVCAPAVLLVSGTTSLAVLTGALVVYGFTRAFPDANMMPILCQITDSRHRATGLGILNTFATLIGGATIYAGGALRDAHLDVRTLFQLGAVGLLVCALLLWRIKPRPVDL